MTSRELQIFNSRCDRFITENNKKYEIEMNDEAANIINIIIDNSIYELFGGNNSYVSNLFYPFPYSIHCELRDDELNKVILLDITSTKDSDVLRLLLNVTGRYTDKHIGIICKIEDFVPFIDNGTIAFNYMLNKTLNR